MTTRIRIIRKRYTSRTLSVGSGSGIASVDQRRSVWIPTTTIATITTTGIRMIPLRRIPGWSNAATTTGTTSDRIR